VSHDVEEYQRIKIFFTQTYPIKELTPLLPGGYSIYEWNA
jgi:hypothetical protein